MKRAEGEPTQDVTGLVSIGVPVYNGEKHIAEALRSLLDQSYRRLEVVISDNGSTDGTEAICRAFARNDARVRYVRQSSNIGVWQNFQFVLEEARGEYFMWAAHDDRWDREWLERLVPLLHDSVVIAFGRVVIIDAAGQETDRKNGLEYKGCRLVRSLRYYWDLEFDGKANIIYGVHRSSIIRGRALSGLDPSLAGMDLILVFRCLQGGEVATDESVALYKRLPVSPEARRSLLMKLRGFLFWGRARYYWRYVGEAQGLSGQVVLAALFPLRLVRSITLDTVAGIRHVAAKWLGHGRSPKVG